MWRGWGGRHGHYAPCVAPCVEVHLHAIPSPHSTPPAPSRRRRKYTSETARLNQQLKSTSQGFKATDKQSDRLQKELEKLRCATVWGGGSGRASEDWPGDGDSCPLRPPTH